MNTRSKDNHPKDDGADNQASRVSPSLMLGIKASTPSTNPMTITLIKLGMG
ncbi:hypothetical protein G5C01_08665 [Moraxella bovoculi]|uniref:hypothetical protein n=1 Tax=Moraxella bovoculi TaxID=386891 RepID=UPI000A952D70|nr:hypothetical protein [Moraxella bovoculi]NSM11418.1 hypothetical protein [Moraxella bovoculi]